MRRIIICFLVFCSLAEVSASPFSWTRVEALQEDIVSMHSDYLEGKVFFALTRSGQLLRTTDIGANWTTIQVGTGDPVRHLWLDISDDKTWYAHTDVNGIHELYYSTNNGDSWEFRCALKDNFRYLSPSPMARGYVLAAFETAGSSQLLLKKTENYGLEWTDVFSASDPGMPPVWHTTSSWQVHWGTFASFDYGETWITGSSKPVHTCGYDIPPSLLAATSEALFRSQDNSLTWWPLLKQPVASVVTNPRNKNQIVTWTSNAGTSTTVYLSTDAGKTFAEWSTGLPGNLTEFCFASDWMFFAVCNGAVYQYDERAADINQSLRVDGADLTILATAFGSGRDEPAYVPGADFNQDGMIDGNDLVVLSAVFGHRFYYDTPKYPGDFPSTDP